MLTRPEGTHLLASCMVLCLCACVFFYSLVATSPPHAAEGKQRANLPLTGPFSPLTASGPMKGRAACGPRKILEV
jgi:hypothetical protein